MNASTFYRPVTLGLTVSTPILFLWRHLLLTDDRGSSEAPAKTLRPADFVPRPRWQSQRDATASSGGSRDIPIRPAEGATSAFERTSPPPRAAVTESRLPRLLM